MKKPIYTFVKVIVFLLFTQLLSAQSTLPYANFSVKPEKRICSLDLEQTIFFIECKSKKKATIYVDLLKSGKLYATTKKTIKSKENTIVKLNFDKKPISKITPGNGYSLRLSMYEGENNNSEKLLSRTFVNDIHLSRLLYSKL